MNEESINIVVSFDYSQVEAGAKKINHALDSITGQIDGVVANMHSSTDAIEQQGRHFSELAKKATETAQSYYDLAKAQRELAVNPSEGKDPLEYIKAAQQMESLAKKYETIAAEMTKEATSSFELFRSLANQNSTSIERRLKEFTRNFRDFDKGLKLNNIEGGVVKPLKDVGDEAERTAKKVEKATGAVSLLKKGFKAFISYKVVKFLGDATAKAIAFYESIHTLKIAAGESAKELYKFVNIVSEKFGINKEEIISATTAFKQMSKNMGLATEQSNILARGFTLMAIDMQALYEISLEDALSRLESVTTGYGRALKNQGMMATNTYLQEIALSLGITERVASMSEANKVGLRYIAVMRQMENAQGEYAKTIESSSNQMRVFKAQVSQTITAVGSLFYNFVSKILPYVNGILMAIRAIIGVIAKFFGFKLEKFEESTGGIADNVGGIGDAASDAAKKMKQLVAPFDELNILSEDTADAGDTLGGLGGSLDPRILEAMKEYDSLMDNVRMKAHDVRDYIMHTLGFTEKLNEETGELEWTWNFGDMVTGLQNAWNDIVLWWSGLDPGAKLASILITAFVGYLAISGLASIVGTITTIITTIITMILSTITTYGTAIVGAVSLPVLAIIALIGLIVAAVIDLWNNNEEFRDKVTKMLDTLWAKLKKIVDDIKKVFNQLITWFMEKFGPDIDAAVQFLKNLWGDFRDFIGAIVLNLLSFFEGFLDFLDGVFTGDIDKALTGLNEMFDSFAVAIGNVFIFIGNAMIDAIDVAVNWVIDNINDFIESINDALGEFGIEIPLIPHIDLSAFKAEYIDVKDMVGTGYSGYDDAYTYNEDYRVGGSTGGGSIRDSREDFKAGGDSYRQNAYAAMSEFTASRGQDIADKIIVQIGGTQVDAEIYKSAQRGGMAAGLQTVGGGFTG